MSSSWIQDRKRIKALVPDPKLRRDVLKNYDLVLFTFSDVGEKPIISMLDDGGKKKYLIKYLH